MRPQWRAPLGSSTDRQTGTDQSRSYAKARLAVHHRSACSGLKACPWLEQGALRNTSGAEAASRQALLPFRSLDPFRALREPDPRRRNEKRPFPLRTKNFSTTQNNRLTGKAAYKSGCEPSGRSTNWSDRKSRRCYFSRCPVDPTKINQEAACPAKP